MKQILTLVLELLCVFFFMYVIISEVDSTKFH